MKISYLISSRVWMCGPAAFLLSVLIMLGMAVWFPKGVASINNLIFPLLSFPLIWACLFFYAYLDPKKIRLNLVFIGLFLVHVGLLAYHFLGGQ